MPPTTPTAGLAEYGRAWSVHQLVPFADKLLGIAGAMDNRMVGQPYDWYLRLPLCALTLVFPTPWLLLVAHVVNIVTWFERMPAVWDYMCWCALTEATFVAAALLGGGAARVAGRFLPAVRAQLVVLYFSAAFWKLTTSWFDTHYSCAAVLMAELLAGLEPFFPFLTQPPASSALLLTAPAVVAGLEFAVPSLLLLRPRWGVLLALTFHQTINLMPTTYAGGFSISMGARMVVFVPGCTAAVGAWLRGAAAPGAARPKAPPASPLLPLFLPIGLVAVATGFMVAIHTQLDSAGAAFLGFATLYFVALTLPPAPPTADAPDAAGFPPAAPLALPKALVATALLTYGSVASVAAGVALLFWCAPRHSTPRGGAKSGSPPLPRRWTALAVLASLSGFAYGFLLPVGGVMMMASSTMYGNVKNYGGGNHLLVPTGLLLDHYDAHGATAVVAPPAWLPPLPPAAAAWLADGFGGGLVRVDATNSSVLRSLFKETTDQLPPTSHALLAQINASGRYYEFYAARNYFEREHDLQATAIHMGVAIAQDDVPPYVVPAYELRRSLALARAREQRFSVTYTRLPAALRTPTEWRGFDGPQVTLHDGRDGGGAHGAACAVAGAGGGGATTPCDASEPALLPPPPYLLTKLLHPYPTPLLDGAGDGTHCST